MSKPKTLTLEIVKEHLEPKFQAFLKKNPNPPFGMVAEKVMRLAWGFVFPKTDPKLLDLLCSLLFESDRGCILAGAAIVDKELENLLRAFFKKRSPKMTAEEIDFFFEGIEPPLRSAAMKIRITFAMGLIGVCTKDASTSLQKWRSHIAAHSLKPVHITTDRVAKIANLLLKDPCQRAPQNQPPMGASKPASVLLLLSHV